jgi:hypothetical protein
MAPRRAAFGQLFDGGFYCLLPFHHRVTNFASLGREGGFERVAIGLKFFDLGRVEWVLAGVKTANRPAAQRHADLAADRCGAMQAPSESVPVVLIVLALNVLAVNWASLVAAMRQCNHRRGSGGQGAKCSKNGQNPTRGKHSKPPVRERGSPTQMRKDPVAGQGTLAVNRAQSAELRVALGNLPDSSLLNLDCVSTPT